jgi:cytochrome c oxidase assembly factor CtaG
LSDFGPIALLIALAAAYTAGVQRAWARAGRDRLVRVHQAVYFALGLAATLAALVGPLDRRAVHSLTAHMVQHVILLGVAAPLLATGEPTTALLWTLPDDTRRRASASWRAVQRSQRGRGWAVWIGATILVQTAVVFAWHVPAVYDAAVRHPLLHGLEHLTFLLSAGAFWWVVAGTGWKSRQGAGVFAVFAGWFPMMGLGVLMTLAATAWYPAYVTGSAAAALRDQQMAGAVMWSVGGLTSVIGAAVLFASWLASVDKRHPPGESIVVPPLEAMR